MSDGPETREQYDLRIKAAERAHDDALKSDIALMAGVYTFATEALKAAVLINGGSAAAMLAFIGTGRQDVTANTIFAMKLFAVGLLLATLAAAASYFAQYGYAIGAAAQARDWRHPFLKPTPSSKRWTFAGQTFHLIGVLLVLGAFGLAVAGFFEAASMLVPMKARA